MSATTFTNTDRTAAEALAQRVNAAVFAGQRVTVDGREVWSRFDTSTPAQVWANGTLSFYVRGRSARAQGEVWVKSGQSVSVEGGEL